MDIRRLTIHQVRVFLTVARRRNFTWAGKDLRLTQSAVSAQIRELTDLLGVPLFEQFGRKIFLTDAGRALEDQALRLEGIIEEIDREFTARREEGAGLVRIGGSTSIGIYFLPSLLAAFSTAYPRTEVSLGIENTAHIETRLLGNDYDVGFVGGRIASRELSTESFVEDEIIFACAPSSPLASEDSLQAGKLMKEKIFVREPGSATRRTMEDFCGKAGFTMHNTVQLGSVEAIKQAVMAGLGISYFSSLTIGHELETGRLVRLKVKRIAMRRSFYLVRHLRKRESPATGTFTEFAREWSNLLNMEESSKAL